MTWEQYRKRLLKGMMSTQLACLYTSARIGNQSARYLRALDRFAQLYGEDREVRVFSAPGRTEIGGNHTDHQRGRVLAAAVNLDIVCIASPNGRDAICLHSEGFEPVEIHLSDLGAHPAERETTAALVRGVAAGSMSLGHAVGGFDAYVTSQVPKGSGLSSSAAFEVVLGTVINHLFNGGAISPPEIAKIGQFAENDYFGKPSGLMDQTAAAAGGLICIDFADSAHPVVETIPFDIAAAGHALCIVDTGGNHADLTADYAAIPAEMGRVAEMFGEEYLRRVEPEAFYEQIPAVRAACGDRVFLRAHHFFEEDKRVARQVYALKKGDFNTFLRLVMESGLSSYRYLQNAYSPGDAQEQGLAVALAVTEKLLGSAGGAWRLQGGGFAGTIQAFVPEEALAPYGVEMQRLFGEGACHRVFVRPVGGVEITADWGEEQ